MCFQVKIEVQDPNIREALERIVDRGVISELIFDTLDELAVEADVRQDVDQALDCMQAIDDFGNWGDIEVK